jgi:hypothetical protein
MLTQKQMKRLAAVGDIQLKHHNGKPIGVLGSRSKSVDITFPYNKFKDIMGLEDLRLHWLLNNNIVIAGGAVLGWILGTKNEGDIDFFFKDKNTLENFEMLINSYSFKKVSSSSCADTYSHEDGVTIQLVGASSSGEESTFDWDSLMEEKYPNFDPFGDPLEVIHSFDLKICQFAVDCDSLYTTSGAIVSVLSKLLDPVNTGTRHNLNRVFKYSRKGFYISDYESYQHIGHNW